MQICHYGAMFEMPFFPRFRTTRGEERFLPPLWSGAGLRSRGTICPGCENDLRLGKHKGAGKSRVPAAPAASRAKLSQAHERSHRGFTGVTRPSPAMVLTAYFVLSPVTGLFCHRHPADFSAKLDTSVGAPGPHDFTVRISIIRPALACLTLPRPSHPAPNVRDDREAPLLWEQDGGSFKSDLGRRRSGIFFRRGLDRIQ
jgi:hypothetical protein